MNSNSLNFQVDQKEFPQNDGGNAETYYDITTSFVPNKPCSLEDFIEFFRSNGYQDYISTSNPLDSVDSRVEEGFRKSTGKEFNGKIIRVLHNTYLKDTSSKDWMSRKTLITFSQDGKYYYALEHWSGDSENGGSADCKVGEINEHKAKDLSVNKYGGSDENWLMKIKA
jgi:hypothetical protein